MFKKRFIIILLAAFLLTACKTTPNNPTPDHTESYPAATAGPLATLPSDSYPAATAADETGSNVDVESVPTEVSTEPTLTPPPPPEPEEEPTESEAPAVDTAVEPAANQPGMGTVAIEAGDGLQIQATYAFPGGVAPYPGVILLHMLGSNRTIWQETGVIDALLRNGYAVMAVDMRGHGETGGEQDWALVPDDMQRVWDNFVSQPEVDSAKTAVIGASIGSNMALVTAVNEPAINTAILLSPGLDYRGVTTDDQIVAYDTRPVFIVASSEDSYAADSSQTLHDLAQGEKQLQLYDGAGHGTAMFSSEPGLTELILEWLKQHLKGI